MTHFHCLVYFTDIGASKSVSMSVIIGAVVGAVVLLLLLAIAGIYALKQKKRAERATDQINPFGKKISGLTLQQKTFLLSNENPDSFSFVWCSQVGYE